MKKQKIVLSVIIFVFILLIATVANAESITAKQIVTSTDGSIDYLIEGLELEQGASYQWAIEKSQNGTIENWYEVLNPEYNSGKIRISILATNEKQFEILKSTDTAYLTIRKVGETNNILSNYELDIALPLLKAFIVEKNVWYGSAPTNAAYDITSIYGIDAKNISYKWEKITDANVVNNYIDNNHDLSGLPLKGKESFPSLTDTSWKSISSYEGIGKTKGSMQYNQIPTQDGLYYLWIQASDTDVKTIYGQAVIEVGEVTKITEQSGNQNGNDGGNSGDADKANPNKSNESKTDGKTDPTTANKILPKTGINIALIGTTLLIIILAVGGAAKYYTYKDIK